MSELPERIQKIDQWLEKAEHDYKTMEYILRFKDDSVLDMACFHAQQCVEKYLKALLVADEIDFPKTHDLVVLFGLIEPRIPLHIDVKELLPLNRYAVESRYPGAWDPITREEAETAVKVTEKLRSVVRSHFSADEAPSSDEEAKK